MKKNLLLLAAFIVLVAFNANAQQTVSVGSTYNYVTTKNISGLGTTVTYTFTGAVAGDYTLGVATNAAGTFTQPITWNAAAAGKTITIHANEATATCTAANTTTLAVTIDATPVTVTFASASTLADCENTSDFTTTVTFSRNMAVSEFPMTLSVAVVVDGVTLGTTTASVTTASAVPTATGTLTLADATFHFNGNATTTAQTQTITINATGSVDNHGGNIGLGATSVHSKVVNPVPVTNAIVPN